jgi:hypothetical protein
VCVVLFLADAWKVFVPPCTRSWSIDLKTPLFSYPNHECA